MSTKATVRNNIWKWLVLGILAAASWKFTVPVQEKVRLGLDLKGGTSFTLGVDTDKLREMIVAADPALTNRPEVIESKIADTLREKGYDIDTQVGIGGYRIDIAIRKNGKYVLGIECDGKLYAVTASARERDYHRQKYLESRGWKIKRIWSMDWWRDPEREIYKICSFVDSLEG
jgi:very-short-patch-repair endonuclease